MCMNACGLRLCGRAYVALKHWHIPMLNGSPHTIQDIFPELRLVPRYVAAPIPFIGITNPVRFIKDPADIHKFVSEKIFNKNLCRYTNY